MAIDLTRNSGLAGIAKLIRHSDILVAVGIVAILVIMIVPMPPAVLDLLLTVNITMSLVVLLVTLYATEPLQFSAFPSLLLIATLFRLALNVSSTRLILLHAYAGKVIESFGNFVVGGDYIVGMVVFIILVIIQFVVITNGAGRVAEVAARFTLDAMPGKQMSIDADLNAGLIDEKEARERRKAIEKEADFYGAMDGASKFVRGDAIAGIIITVVNILGGIVIGLLRFKMSVLDAMERYALLTVGDGLVTQIPALLISTATGLIVTRAASESNLGEDLARQILAQPRAVAVGAGMMLLFGMIPGLPKLPFFMIAAAAGVISYAINTPAMKEKAEQSKKPPAQPKAPENFMSLLALDPLELEIGYALLPLADESEGGDLLDRVTAVRRQAALDLGLVLPHIRVRDNIQLRPNDYAIKIKGVEVARGEALVHHYLAMNPGIATEPLEGLETKDPAFGMPAVWITEDQKERAEMAGYAVVDPASVIITHLSEIVKSHAPDLLSRQDVQSLLDNLKKAQPAVVDEVVPNLLTVGEVQKVLQNLLRERISIRDIGTIMEALGDYARVTRDTDALTEQVRVALGRQICRQYQNENGELIVTTVDPGFEEAIARSMGDASSAGERIPAIEPGLAQKFIRAVADQVSKMVSAGHTPVLLTSPHVRLYIRRLLERSLPNLAVLSYGEIVDGHRVRTVGMVKLNDEN